MRRFYVTDFEVWRAPHDFGDGHMLPFWHVFDVPGVGSHGIHLLNYSSTENEDLIWKAPDEWEALPEVQAWRAAGSPTLFSGAFKPESGHFQNLWHGHPKVAILPDPQSEGNIRLSDLLVDPTHKPKKFARHHLQALSIIGVTPAHTVWDVHRLASARCPTCRLGNTS